VRRDFVAIGHRGVELVGGGLGERERLATIRGTDTIAGRDAVTDSGANADRDAKPHAVAESNPQSDAVADSGANAESDAIADCHAVSDSRADANGHPEPDAERKPDADREPNAVAVSVAIAVREREPIGGAITLGERRSGRSGTRAIAVARRPGARCGGWRGDLCLVPEPERADGYRADRRRTAA